MPLVVAMMATGGCRIARPDAPEWIEAHGRGQVVAIAADVEGAIALGSNRRIYSYPGPYGQPWVERYPQEGIAVGAGGGVVAWTGVDGIVRVVPAGGNIREVPGSREWRATAVAVGPDGLLYVVSSNRAFAVGGDALADPICDGVSAVAVAAASSGVYVVRTDGTVTVRRAGQCLPVLVPFHVTSLAVAGDELAAIDEQSNVWRRHLNNWEKLPKAIAYRPDAFPSEAVLRQVAMTESVLWARSEGMQVFILSDPT